MKLSEDLHFTYRYLYHCSKIASTSAPLYYYNRTNGTSATRVAYEDEHRWLANTLAERERIFTKEGKPVPLTEFRAAADIVRYVLGNYAAGYPREHATRKVGETCRIFGEFFEKIPANFRELFPDNDSVRFCCDVLPWVKSADYESVYSVLREEHERNTKKRGFKAFVRKVLLKPEQFVVFKLGWFYKK